MFNHDETNDETQSEVVDELRARVDSLEREVDRLHELLRHTQTELEQAHTIVSQQQVLMLQTTGKSTDSTDGAADEQHAPAWVHLDSCSTEHRLPTYFHRNL